MLVSSLVNSLLNNTAVMSLKQVSELVGKSPGMAYAEVQVPRGKQLKAVEVVSS
jgi:hypothetical protein